MARRHERKESFASSVTMLTFIVVAASVTGVGLVALAGVYGLAQHQVAARQTAYRQAVGIEVTARFDSAVRALEGASGIIRTSADSGLDRAALAELADANAEYIDELLVVQENGTVSAAYPSIRAPRSVSDMPVYESSIGPEPRFFHDRSSGSHVLWITQRATEAESGLWVLARVRTRFLQLLVDEFSSSSENRQVAIADDDGIIVTASDVPQLNTESLVYSPVSSGQQRGTVAGTYEDGTVVWGQYATRAGYPGLDWRALVVEPRGAILQATWGALAPATILVFIAGVGSVAVAGVFARRLSRPLLSLEDRAREAASGAYMRPIETDRADEVGRLAEAFNAIALRLNSLHDLTQLLATTSNLDQVLDGILDAIEHIVGRGRVAVFLLDQSGMSLRLARCKGLDDEIEVDVPLASRTWLTAALDAQGPASFTVERAEAERILPGLEGEGPVSGLLAPLSAGKEPLGVAVIFGETVREFSEAELEMVRTFSAQAAVAVNTSRLFQEEKNSRREAEAMRDVAERLTSPRSLEGSFDGVMHIVRDLFGFSAVAYAFLDRASLGLAPATDPLQERLLLRAWHEVWDSSDGDTLVRAARGGEPAVDRLLDHLDAEEALLLTVVRGLEPAAVVALLVDGSGRAVPPEESSLLDSFAKQLSLALDNLYHYAQATARAGNLETIFRISQAVSSSLQIKVVLNRVLDVVQKIFGADAVSLMEYDSSRKVVATVMARGVVSGEMLRYVCLPSEDVPGRVFASGVPAKIDDMVDTDSALAAAALTQGLRSMLSVPLLARGRSLGVLTVFSAEPSAFSDEDMGLLHTFGSQAALAIDTADLYGKEHHIASVLQHSILPAELPEFPEVEASSAYLPAGEEAEIGGDYFDLLRTPAGEIAMVIGDVCGKGVAAATKTSRIKYSVGALIAAGLGPARVISEVNKIVSESGDPSDIVTLWVGMLDAGGSRLRYANGGHPPGLLYRKSQSRLVRLAPTGPLLGAMAEASYVESTARVSPGDVVVLYTDGVTEARRGGKFFGEGRVRRAIAYGGSAEKIVERLLTALNRFIPGSLRDDAAILAVRVRGGFAQRPE